MDQFERYWAGTEESLQQYLLGLHLAVKQGYYDRPAAASQPSARSRLLSAQGSVGLIQSKGSLVNSDDADLNAYLGRTGYGEIREAFIQAAQDPNVKVILHYVASGGGHVAGVNDTSELIARVDSMVKPVVTYTDSVMCSAAYWIGSAGRRLYASQFAEIGSIGVLAVHTEYSKLMADIGITATVFRSGPFKGLGLPVEPLSDVARETLQASIDYSAKLFTEKMAARRGMTVEAFEAKVGQGRVFTGELARAAGLVDGIVSFDDLVSSLEAAANKEGPRV